MTLSYSGTQQVHHRGPSIYVLDDDGSVGDAICGMLSDEYCPHAFTDPDLFLNRIRASSESARPKTIILDLVLHSSDAIEIIHHLHSLHYKGKVMLMSGRDDAMLDEIAKIGVRHELAMLPPLRKPFRAADLKQNIESSAKSGPPTVRTEEESPLTIGLHQAMSNQWLELWYQPKIDLKTISICGIEALLRARHPKHGYMLPTAFLPPPGDPLYHPLSRFVVRRAAEDWTRYFRNLEVPLKVSINIPVSVIRSRQFVRVLRDSLPRDETFPGLIIEVTEDEAIHEPSLTREIAHQLRLYDVSLSIDDFGSAYSSLQRLRDLPIVEIKLDRSLVSDCAQDRSNRALCESAIALAHRFGATVCAEGVDNVRDLKTLIELGCDQAQGFLFSRPVPGPELVKMADMAQRLIAMQSIG